MNKLVEVEQKYRVADFFGLEGRLTTAGYQEVAQETHTDTYLRHPCRDFRATDEAFRIRQTNDSVVLTYKGPRQESQVKCREEIELQLQSSELPSLFGLVARLGFEAVKAVQKTRRVFRNPTATAGGFTIALDSVDELGTFVEVELVVGREQTADAAASILEFAGELGLQDPESRSYLAMLAAKYGEI